MATLCLKDASKNTPRLQTSINALPNLAGPFQKRGGLSDLWKLASILLLFPGGQASAQQVVAGSYHTLALRQDGTVWAWGQNSYGQLGDGTSMQRTNPVRVPGLSGVVALAAGQYHSLAVKSDGTVWAWGYNLNGQLGDGTTTQRTGVRRQLDLPPDDN